MPVAYIPRTRELYNAYTPYRWVMNEEPPSWTPLKKPLAECKVALMSSGGVLYRDQPRFHREDTSYRLIPIRPAASNSRIRSSGKTQLGSFSASWSGSRSARRSVRRAARSSG